MRTIRAARAAGLGALVVLALVSAAPTWPVHARAQSADTLPTRLSNEDFWKLSQDLSEPNGSFRSDNLVSNEMWLQWVIPDLLTRSRQGGVYVGVGPEQNFTYIAALKPKMVFITDVRRGNLHMHLTYKALFEMATNRADFMERLFNKKRPAGLTDASTAEQLINAFWDVNTSAEAVYRTNLKAVQDHLTKTRGLPLGQDDLDGIEYVYWSFYWYGPLITYSSSGGGRGGGNMASYGDLILSTDGSNVNRGFLASEANFRVIKDLHSRNLIVPVVGNFAGPKALRAVGKYVRDHGATIAAMYLSNVEQYLRGDGIWGYFCGNVASMPLDAQSTFIRSQSSGRGGGSGLANSLGSMKNETAGCVLPEPLGVQ
jgi:hypothetical protein